MELVYLWVKEYKNIKKQGFNFSPRFECNYDAVTNKLTIDENKEYKSIFPDNINVTAIVGENGSGKSSILKSILTIDDFDNDFIIIYKDSLGMYYHSTIKGIITDIPRRDTYSKHSFIAYISFQHDHYAYREYSIIEIGKQSIINILVTNKVKQESFSISSFMYLPNQIEITFKEPKSLIKTYINFVVRDRDKVSEYFNSFTDYSFDQFLLIQYLKDSGTSFEIKTCMNITQIKNYFNDSLETLKKVHKSFLKLINTKIFKFDDENIFLYIKAPYFDYFEFDLIDTVKRRYSNLSSGEQVLFGQLLQIHFYLKNRQDALFLLDEPESFLHPEWQKSYLKELMDLVSLFTENKVHFLITSHSPFLLSDLPKENVIFLEKGKQVDVDIETFGANIHTLLSHGFFMKGGLMGEFAKGKINDAIARLNQTKLSEYDIKFCENIIKITGEPIIKRQMQKMLDSKRLSKIDELEAEMELMKHRIEILRKNQ